MSEQLIGVIIGGTFGFLGAILGNVLVVWAERRRESRESLQAVRLRLVGDRVQTSEIMRFIETQRERSWPYFWKKGPADLSRARLEGVDFRNQDLRHVIFYHANLQGANFLRAKLQGCDFTEANLSQASLYEARASGAILFRTNLQGAELLRTDLSRAGMVEANFKEASLLGARLGRADIRFANLEGARVEGCDLSEVNLAGADLSGTVLTGTNLQGAVYNDETVWPQAFEPEAAGATWLELAGSKSAMAKAGLAWRWGRIGAAVEGG